MKEFNNISILLCWVIIENISKSETEFILQVVSYSGEMYPELNSIFNQLNLKLLPWNNFNKF